MPEPGVKERQIKAYWDEQIRLAKIKREPFIKQRELVHRHYLADFDTEMGYGSSSYPEEWSGTGGDRATMSVVYSSAKTIAPHLFFKNPSIAAESESAPERAKIHKKFGGYLQVEQGYKEVMKAFVLFSLLDGGGAIISEFCPIKRIPRRRRISMENILVNPDATEDIKSVTWVAERFRVPIRKARANKAYKHAKDIPVAATTLDEDSHVGHIRDEELANLIDQATGWRIWVRDENPGLVIPRDATKQKGVESSRIDEVKNRIITIFDDSPFIHQDDFWPFVMDHDETPITFMRFNLKEGTFWPFSDFSTNKNMQNFINWQLTFILRHMR